MGPYTEADKQFLKSQVDGLNYDSSFDITSDPTPIYNCIGFAMGMKDVWVALGHPSNLPWFWWPPTAPADENPCSLVKAFEYFGFTPCTNGNVEADYDKVALYAKNGKWTHAAKIIKDNLYNSKMGECWDIVHRSGDVFHNDDYGDVFAYMKRPILKRDLTQLGKPTVGKAKFGTRIFVYMQYKGGNCGWVEVPDEDSANKLLSLT